MATIQKFEDIEAWKLGRELCKKIGLLIDSGKFKRNYRLIDQLEGSSGSIMDNIAEGFERGSRAEFMTFLGYSNGSSGRFRSQFYRARDRNYLTQLEFDELYRLATHISSCTEKFIQYLQKTDLKGVRRNNFEYLNFKTLNIYAIK